MLKNAAGNLWKRKLRSALTIMGVVIGVASIVVMVSLGLGLSKSMLEEYASYGKLTQITVQTPYSESNSVTEYRLDDALVQQLSEVEHVEAVYPELDISVMLIYGAYSSYVTLKGMPVEALADMELEVEEGSVPDGSEDELTFFYGNEILMGFENSKTGASYWTTGVLPDIDLMNDSIFTVFDTSAYMASQSTGSSTTPPKKYLVPAAGVQKESENYSVYGWNAYCDINQLIAKLKQVFKKGVIPGQPTTKSGKRYPDIYYSVLQVDVDEMDNVAAVQSYIEGMGYNAYSNSEWISSSMKSMNMVQGVLGGIGAVSLLVAAIGIVNTMMMSIYERTKEIGVMKVLGCSLENIRTMFLLEAGMIGLVGGIFGLGVSYIASALINYVSQGSDFLGIQSGTGGLSRIPLWLALLSIVFAIIVSMVAGFFPSQKAMKLSPLAAIRNE